MTLHLTPDEANALTIILGVMALQMGDETPGDGAHQVDAGVAHGAMLVSSVLDKLGALEESESQTGAEVTGTDPGASRYFQAIRELRVIRTATGNQT